MDSSLRKQIRCFLNRVEPRVKSVSVIRQRRFFIRKTDNSRKQEAGNGGKSCVL
ncbi:hypothetical protein BGLY_0101 [Bacillus glycinifermentans]|nr:hypothetical protein BGLY_0101 [Bacillus glycinifermentans]